MRIGVDLGGTKIEAIALADDDRVLLRERVATPQGDYRATLAAVVEKIHATERELGTQGTVGVGTPGSPSPATGLIRNANSTCLNGRPLARDLSTLLQREVRIANDADCFTLSEASDGAAQDTGTVFGVILGTGVGGGICHAGQLLSGPNLVAGEWGHNPLPWPRPDEIPGPACYCGKHGCIETFLCGPGLSQSHSARSAVSLSAEQIARGASSGDADCGASLDTYLDRLARALASVINLLDPGTIVLGGGLSNISELYDQLPQRLPEYVFSDTLNTLVVPPRHGDSSGVRGAARLWPR